MIMTEITTGWNTSSPGFDGLISNPDRRLRDGHTGENIFFRTQRRLWKER